MNATMKKYPSLLVLFVAILLLSSPTLAQKPILDVEMIMQGSTDWVGSWPSQPFWSERGDSVYFYWNPNGLGDTDSLYAFTNQNTDAKRVKDSAGLAPRFRGWQHGASGYNHDFTQKVFVRDGDLFLFDMESYEQRRISRTVARESNPQFQKSGQSNGNNVVYRMGSNLYAMDLSTMLFSQLTDIKTGSDPDKEKDLGDQEQYLENQQEELFEIIKEQKEKEERREEMAEKEEKNHPTPFYLGSMTLSDLRISPAGRFITVKTASKADDQRTLVQNYVNETGFAEDFRARAKVGRPDQSYEMHIIDTEVDTTYAVDFTVLDGAYDIHKYKKERGEEVDSTSVRGLVPYGPYWNKSGDQAFLIVKSIDNKDRWLVKLDAESGSITELNRQHDEAWIAGPGISWYGGGDRVGWMPDGKHFWFQSEESGYSHLYTIDIESGKKSALTKGNFEIYNPRLSKDGLTWMFESSEVSPYVKHSYTMPANGGERTQISTKDGSNDFIWSPSGDQIASLYSYSNQPPEVFLISDPEDSSSEIKITDSPSTEWKTYPWQDPEIIFIEGSDGVEIPARIYRPENANGGAVLFVHGAGYLHNVHKWWSSYHREYMFHNLLSDLGYVVLDLDFRGSAGYGRDWRTAIYRHMGGRDLQDYVDASDYVNKRFDIDKERIGIYGGSYGGFISLMALFNEGEHFGAGAALRSVTDWAHYNHGYTSNILNTPAEDSVAYQRSSPINFAEGLSDPLLIAHGVIDTNVQFQDVVRLAQRLIELGKEDWEMALYPVEGHGFREPTSWTDEYKRILKLMNEHIGQID